MAMKDILTIVEKLNSVGGKVYCEGDDHPRLMVLFGGPFGRRLPVSLDMVTRQTDMTTALKNIREKSTKLKSTI